ncbi:MAG: legumain, partial [Muribaculaceae bacterium]|nr:legumain [Muribaculaceae bacterium]
MKKLLDIFFIIATLTALWGCSKEEIAGPGNEKPVIEKTVAVILPMEKGLDRHWKNIFTLLDHNIDKALSLEEKKVKLNIEWYDESREDLEKLAGELAAREDLYAVIG